MFRNYRQRRGPYALAEPSRTPSTIGRLIVLVIALFLVYIIGKWLLGLVGFGRNEQNASALLSMQSGTVNVSVDGGLMQHAQDEMKVYAGDRLSTGNDGFATLTMFDGTSIRLDELSEATLEKSTQGDESSSFVVELTKGNAWIQTPTVNTLSGSLARSIKVGNITYGFPTDSEALVKQNVILVFSGDGNGVTVEAKDRDDSFFIGEGQQWTMPEGGTISGDPLRFRSAIDPLLAQSTFVLESREQEGMGTGSGSTVDTESDILTVTAPEDDETVAGTTVKVTGSIGDKVDRVRVNSYLASVDTVNKTFTQELAVADTDTMTIRIEALDENSVILQAITRTVKRGAVSAMESPSITSPAKTGETYRSQKTEFNIQGTAPRDAYGIMVNDYRLQLFRPGDTTWAYLASTALDNLKQGENIFDVYALDENGRKSEPSRLTIVVGEGTPGVISGSNGSAASSVAVVDESTLPKNDPLTPGALAVTGPAAGSQFTATGSEFLLEGTTSKETTSVWVNGYKLQLFKVGGGYWNYIAKTEYGTLKRGTNVYKITARNSKDEILDVFEYTVTFNP